MFSSLINAKRLVIMMMYIVAIMLVIRRRAQRNDAEGLACQQLQRGYALSERSLRFILITQQ